MKRVWAVLNRLLHPPKWMQFVLPPIIFAALIRTLLMGEDGISAYIIYGLSAYGLVLWILPMPQLFRKARASIMNRLTGTAFGRNYVEDPAFRGSVNICQGMTINFLYVAFRIFVSVRYVSVWFITIAVYYLLLGLMRLSLILCYRSRTAESELRCYRRTARRLFLLNIPMGIMITIMVLTDSGYSYPGYIIYLSAMYTFYTVILSVVNLVKYRKLGSPILSAAKVLNFIAALMSLLGLQTAMISRFSTGEKNFGRTMNAVAGGSIWIIVILIAVYMLLHSRRGKRGKTVDPLGK